MTDVFPPHGPSFLRGQGFSIGTDAILLYHFSRRCRAEKAVDLGCGSGVIGILLAMSSLSLSVTAVDIDPEAVDAARGNAVLNGVEDRFRAVLGDIREIRSLWPAGTFDLAVMNPPYYAVGTGKLPVSPSAAAARSEMTCTLEDACFAASWSGAQTAPVRSAAGGPGAESGTDRIHTGGAARRRSGSASSAGGQQRIPRQ